MKITTIIFLILSSFNCFSQIPTNGLVAYYPFNGNANDVSGNGNSATINTASLTTDRFGIANSAYNFNGVNSSISVPDANSLDLDNLTISVWVYVSDTGISKAVQTILNKPRIGGGTGYQIEYFYNNKWVFNGGIQNTKQYGVNSINYPNLKQWYSVMMTFDGTNYKVYINNVLNGVIAGTKPQVSTLPLTIGSLEGNGRYFNGKIDDIRIYNRALSESELSILYQENRCFEKVMVSDTLRISGAVTGLNDLPSNFGTVKIFPNPAHSILNIEVSNPSNIYSIKITNSTSQEVYSNQLMDANYQINLSSFGSKGLYFIQILDNTNKILETKKLILE